MKKLFDVIVRKYLYMKLCFNRSFSHLSVVFQIINFMILASVWLKMYVGAVPHTLIIGIGIVMGVSLFVIGHLDLTFNIMKRETSLANSFNPEIQLLLKRGEEKKDGPL